MMQQLAYSVYLLYWHKSTNTDAAVRYRLEQQLAIDSFFCVRKDSLAATRYVVVRYYHSFL
jgi:hypothetical protein